MYHRPLAAPASRAPIPPGNKRRSASAVSLSPRSVFDCEPFSGSAARGLISWRQGLCRLFLEDLLPKHTMPTRFPTRSLKRLKAARPLAKTSMTSRPRPQPPREPSPSRTCSRDDLSLPGLHRPVTSALFTFGVVPGVGSGVLRVHPAGFLRDEAEFMEDLGCFFFFF